MGGIEGRRSNGHYEEFKIEEDRSFPVAIQDRKNEVFTCYFSRKTGTIVLLSPTTSGAQTITLVPGHGVVAGDLITISEGVKQYQGFALSLVGDVVTMDSSLDHAYTVAAVAEKGSNALNVNGSVTPVVFSAKPGVGATWHVNGIAAYLIDDVAMDDAKFAGITALTKGIIIRRVDGLDKNIANIKTNAGFRVVAAQSFYSDKAPAGKYGFFSGMNTEQFFGAVFELVGATSDELQIIVQDDLTGVESFRSLIHGHVAVD